MDGSSTTATDSSGSGNDATVTGAVWIIGQIGGALQYADGDIVTAATPVDLAAEWTISFWFTMPLPNTGEPWHTMTRAQGDDHQVIVQSSTMELGTYLNSGGGFYSTGFKIDVLSTGWHHMAAVGSGTTTAFYIDGASVGSSSAKSTTEVYGFGAHYSGVQRFTDAIDDIRIYDRALSTSEVSFLFGDGSDNLPPTARISASTTTGNLSEVLSFDGSGLLDPEGSISSYAWDFGDRNSSSGAATTHAWLSAGTFTVALTVTNDRGATAVDTVQVTITGADTTPPVIALTVMGIAGTVDDPAVGTIDITGTSFPVAAGAFSAEVSITVSPSNLTVTGTNLAGDMATRNLLVSQ